MLNEVPGTCPAIALDTTSAKAKTHFASLRTVVSFHVKVEGRGDGKRSLLAERAARMICWASYGYDALRRESNVPSSVFSKK